MTTDLTAEICAAEQDRCAAMIGNDIPVLDAILDDELQFHHSNGAVDDKAAYLAKLGAGRISYSEACWTEQRVAALSGSIAMLTGRMEMRVTVGGMEKRLAVRAITVWRSSVEGWKLVAFQSTPLSA